MALMKQVVQTNEEVAAGHSQVRVEVTCGWCGAKCMVLAAVPRRQCAKCTERLTREFWDTMK